MTQQDATQIASLLNSRNQLSVEYTSEIVLKEADSYLFEGSSDGVIACVQVKKVQWYQWEICHLSVRKNHEGKGLGKRLIRAAEERLASRNARIAQCTIRIGNEASERVFRRSGYRETCCFYNRETAHYVAVWQKVLICHP